MLSLPEELYNPQELGALPLAALIPALAAYERNMIDYGFEAVRTSLANMRRLHAESTLSRFATKTMFRVANVLPPLQRIFRSER
jgi:hypothetical protein